MAQAFHATFARSTPAAAVCAVCVVCAVFLPATSRAQQEPGADGRRGVRIEDYYRLKGVGAPRISPDGEWVVYSVATRIERDNTTRAEAWLVPADGRRAPRRLEHEGRDVTVTGWRGDAVLLYQLGQHAFALNLADRRLRAERDAPWRPDGVVSRDGRRIATAVRPRPDSTPAVHASDFERRHAERFRGVQFDWLNYKRDGARMPVPDPRDPRASPAAEIVVAEVGGRVARQITQLGLLPSDLEWTPDGEGLVFTADDDYRDELKYGAADLWHARLDGTVKRLTDDGYVHAGPTFSPDGRLLAYTRTTGTDMVIAEGLDHGGPRDLFVRGWPEGGPRNLTDGWDLEPAAPVWSPDSRYVYFAAGIGGETHLFRAAAEGGAVERVTHGPRRIAGITFDRAFRKMAYTVSVHERPPEVYVANIDGTDERRLTDVHAAWLDDVQPARAERVEYRSYDGTPIEGWLLLPHDYRADGGPYPLIVSNHGGPHSSVGYGYEFKGQLFAAHGYLVLEVNFRGSTGYGEAFKWATWGAWGTRDGEDVMAGIDHVVAHYPVDARRVGVTGHSYGGFLTNWLIAQYPDRFAAAVSGAGISNWISDYGMADIARTKETEFRGKPWEARAREIMIRQSPLFYADRVRAPTLFVHGELDYRVPFAESEQFYFALKKNGVPAKLIRYEGQSHGIGGHWNNVHRMINELRWWDTWLKGATSS